MEQQQFTDPRPDSATVPGYSPWTLAVREEFRTREYEPLASECREDITIEVCKGRHSLWVVVRWPDGGGLAIRASHCPDGEITLDEPIQQENATVYRVRALSGDFEVRVELLDPERAMVRLTTSLTPCMDLTLPFVPNDVYPLDAEDDPVPTEGVIHAAQRGTAGGLLYASLVEPRSGSFLYMQDLASLNPYFETTGTKPDTCVGGSWPELGYTAPSFIKCKLRKDEKVTLSDALIRISPEVPAEEKATATLFLDMLADLYPHLTKPEVAYHHWPDRAEETRDALESSEKCHVEELGYLYLHPYLDSEYPDSMVQLSVLAALLEYQDWWGRPLQLTEALRQGVPEFYDAQLGAVRRYLKTVGGDKDRNEVDSWYLYHPLINLARLALRGDQEARHLFLGSMEYAIRAAHHFDYRWPIQFDLRTMGVITLISKLGEPGQADVGGLYAYAMLQAHDITGEQRYVDEAMAATRALEGLHFSIGYQFNNVAWGAVACMRLWQITGDRFFCDQAYSFLASFFHNTYLWESDLAHAKHYPTFLGVACLHDGDYMAAYEEFEAFAAFHELVERAGDDIRPSVRILLAEYCRHLLNRGWFYYPQELPEDALATEIRNGHLDRSLAIPVEDLYADGSPAGAVGQEIYGSGMSFALVTRSYRNPPGAPFQVYTDYPIRLWNTEEEGCVTFQVGGAPGFASRLRLLGDGSGATVRIGEKGSQRKEEGRRTDEGHLEYWLPGGASVAIEWEPGDEAVLGSKGNRGRSE